MDIKFYGYIIQNWGIPSCTRIKMCKYVGSFVCYRKRKEKTK